MLKLGSSCEMQITDRNGVNKNNNKYMHTKPSEKDNTGKS